MGEVLHVAVDFIVFRIAHFEDVYEDEEKQCQGSNAAQVGNYQCAEEDLCGLDNWKANSMMI
jgi:hypothetical protein